MRLICQWFTLQLDRLMQCRWAVAMSVSLDLSTPTGMTCIVTLVENGKPRLWRVIFLYRYFLNLQIHIKLWHNNQIMKLLTAYKNHKLFDIELKCNGMAS